MRPHSPPAMAAQAACASMLGAPTRHGRVEAEQARAQQRVGHQRGEQALRQGVGPAGRSGRVRVGSRALSAQRMHGMRVAQQRQQAGPRTMRQWLAGVASSSARAQPKSEASRCAASAARRSYAARAQAARVGSRPPLLPPPLVLVPAEPPAAAAAWAPSAASSRWTACRPLRSSPSWINQGRDGGRGSPG